MDAVRIGLAGLLVLGFGLTLWGLLQAWRGARKDLRAARRKARKVETLWEEERRAWLDIARLQGEESRRAQEGLIVEYTRRHEANGFARPPGYAESYIPGREATFVFEALRVSASRNLLVAAAGVGLSTLASVLAVFLL